MNVNSKILYNFQITAKEFNIIRKALLKAGNEDAENLAKTMNEKRDQSMQELKKVFGAMMELSVKEGAE